MDVITPAYDRGVRFGYQKGEMERIALATANSDLRSQVRELRAENRSIMQIVAAHEAGSITLEEFKVKYNVKERGA